VANGRWECYLRVRSLVSGCITYLDIEAIFSKPGYVVSQCCPSWLSVFVDSCKRKRQFALCGYSGIPCRPRSASPRIIRSDQIRTSPQLDLSSFQFYIQ
jgi:hypothetical protein